MNDYAIVIDIDWASDEMIAEVSRHLTSKKVKATWFVTHDSPEVRRLQNAPDLFEVGVHPNFCKGSTQGKTPEDIMNNLMEIVPRAKSCRMHSMMQSTPILKMLRENFGMHHDASLLLPDTSGIAPHELYFSKDSSIMRFPCYWEDDVEMSRPIPSFSMHDIRYHIDGLKIFDFHPVHIFLNSHTMDNYMLLKMMDMNDRRSESKIRHLRNAISDGVGTFFVEILELISNSSGGITITELAKKWRETK